MVGDWTKVYLFLAKTFALVPIVGQVSPKVYFYTVKERSYLQS